MAIYLLPFVISSILAIAQEIKLVRFSKAMYAAALLILALFAGLRFEVGQDWEAYESLFVQIVINANLFNNYSSNHQQFEIGYYALNYLVKLIGLNYHGVFVVVAFFLSYAIYKFSRHFSINKFYVLSIYISYSYLILNFAQVRQAAAIGFLLLACDYYIRRQNKLRTLLIASLGILFQYTALMYVVLMLIVFLWPPKINKNITIGVLISLIVIVLLIKASVDFYVLIGFLTATVSAQDKLAIYKDMQTSQGAGQLIYAGYLFVLLCYLNKYGYQAKNGQKFVIQYAIASLYLTIIFVVIFPGSYVFYSRAYVVASLFQAYACAIIFTLDKNILRQLFIFFLTLVISFVFYFRLLSLYDEEYLPYRSIIGQYFL